MLTFLAGFLIGGIIGFIGCAIFAVGAIADERERLMRYYENKSER